MTTTATTADIEAFSEAAATLWPSERRTLDPLAQGLSNEQIAAAAGVSPKTVKNQVASVLFKLEMGNRAQAGIFAARLEERAAAQISG
jgi:DNA-binding NarL/FixJ family response regulator